jgi:UDP-N-acetylglucosamine:LPS N-acetylglucosamine transferase
MSNLAAVVLELLVEDDKRAQMSAAMRSMAHPDAAAKIADLLVNLKK